MESQAQLLVGYDIAAHQTAVVQARKRLSVVGQFKCSSHQQRSHQASKATAQHELLREQLGSAADALAESGAQFTRLKSELLAAAQQADVLAARRTAESADFAARLKVEEARRVAAEAKVAHQQAQLQAADHALAGMKQQLRDATAALEALRVGRGESRENARPSESPLSKPTRKQRAKKPADQVARAETAEPSWKGGAVGSAASLQAPLTQNKTRPVDAGGSELTSPSQQTVQQLRNAEQSTQRGAFSSLASNMALPPVQLPRGSAPAIAAPKKRKLLAPGGSVDTTPVCGRCTPSPSSLTSFSAKLFDGTAQRWVCSARLAVIRPDISKNLCVCVCVCVLFAHRVSLLIISSVQRA